jgi:hypothetical protein
LFGNIIRNPHCATSVIYYTLCPAKVNGIQIFEQSLYVFTDRRAHII